MLTQSTRPRLKADTHFVPISEGVYLRRNQSRLTLKGKSLYPLLEHLAPHLNGQHTLAEITGGLDADRQRMVTNLLEKLFARDFLQDMSQESISTLSPLDQETHAPDLTFIESFHAASAQSFERFCAQRLLLIGAGRSFAALVQASLQAGIHKIAALQTPEEAPITLPTEDVTLLEAPAWEQEKELRALIQNYDAVLHVAERPMLARARLLNRLCRAEGKTLLQALLVDEHAWLGPLVAPETGYCWECAWRRLQANAAAFTTQPTLYAWRDQPDSPRSQLLARPAAEMLAYRLVFSFFQAVTQSGAPELASQLCSLDLATYLSSRHSFQPHPFCQACQSAAPLTSNQFRRQLEQFQARESQEPEALLDNLSTCIDEKLGLFTAFDTRNFAQAPLAVYQVQLSSPLPPEEQDQPLSISAVSVDNREAVTRAARLACARYAASLVDQRRLLSDEAARQAGAPVFQAEQFCTKKPLSALAGWTWALDLREQEPVLVPAGAVFAEPGERGRGLGTGQSWEEALSLALLDWCQELTVRHLLEEQPLTRLVDLTQVALTSEGRHLAQLLQVTGGLVEVYDITGPVEVPAFATCLEGQAVAYTAHWEAAQALSLGLEQALQAYQSRQDQQPDYAPAPVLAFPEQARSTEMCVPRSVALESWSARLEWLLQRLGENGLRACVVPLDHDPALKCAQPFIVRVLLSESAGKKGE